jgi:hypothetical protein
VGKLIISAIYNLIHGVVARLVNATLRAPMATATFLLAITGGIAATDSWIGHFIGWVIGLLWWWTPYAVFLAGSVVIVGDCAREGVAERLAIYLSLVVPSAGMAMPHDGKLYHHLASWIGDIDHWLDKNLGAWIGGGGKHAVLTLVSVAAIVMAVLYCERYAKKNGDAKITAAGPSATPSPSPRPGPAAARTPASRRARS